MHYLIIIAIIVCIVISQFLIISSTIRKINLFNSILPGNQVDYDIIQNNNSIMGIISKHKNEVLETIIISINNYLHNNKGAVSDFHLIKDIVDRNCDAKEEEIHTQIPVPLYLGLVGTMIGILVGVGFLVLSGGLNDLLNSGSKTSAEGIETLLGGVALAMISSIIGILLTTYGAYKIKNAKSYIEKNKNIFLSWMQAELLPNLSSNTSSALIRMTKNLSNFNNSFAQNTQDLKGTLSIINNSYKNQSELMQAINQLKIEEIAKANIDVYDKLKNSTNEIGVFTQFLQKTNEYLVNLQSLNQKLDDYEKRTQIIENAGRFFSKNEKWLSENFDIANLEVKSAIERFKDNTSQTLSKLQESFDGQFLKLDDVMNRQQEILQENLIKSTENINDAYLKTLQIFEESVSNQQLAFKEKLQETTKLIEELKNLTEIKKAVENFEKISEKQNGKIDELTNSIKELAETKASGDIRVIPQMPIIPGWIKISTITVGAIVTVTCFSVIISLLLEWVFK